MDSFKSLLMKVNPVAPRPKDGEPLLLAPNDKSWWWGCSFDTVPESFAAVEASVSRAEISQNRVYRTGFRVVDELGCGVFVSPMPWIHTI
ncbi:hypothetical protein AgCh_035825 [Apium graveolens]